jgi:hypothetical protein
MHRSTEATLIAPRWSGAAGVDAADRDLELSEAGDGRLPPHAVSSTKAAVARIAAARTM